MRNPYLFLLHIHLSSLIFFQGTAFSSVRTSKVTPSFLYSTVDDNHTTETTRKNEPNWETRRSILSRVILTTSSALLTGLDTHIPPASATITKDSNWNLWPALPVAPYSRRRTIRYEVSDGVWAFDQMIGIYYVHVPIRMSVVAVDKGKKMVVY